MITGVYRFAGIPAQISTTCSYLHDRCAQYKSNETPQVSVCVAPEDIAFEREMARREAAAEKIPFRDFGTETYEFTAAYRNLVEELAFYDVFLMHGSAIAVDGKSFLFTAKSGTGKSTHTRLWREYLADRVIMINDDKPLLRIESAGQNIDRFTSSKTSLSASDKAPLPASTTPLSSNGKRSVINVYGTPWDGKHQLSSNVHAPLSAICILEQAANNQILRVKSSDVLPLLLQQIYRPRSAEALKYVITSACQAFATTPVYRLRCNMDVSAAQIAYEALCKSDT